ncbi:hypothetical protein [Enterocloster sp.]|uniref:hypothetical protein n=1 Tax=Enterocloster sp. TaxID=2719315 RepID=UPI00399F236F
MRQGGWVPISPCQLMDFAADPMITWEKVGAVIGAQVLPKAGPENSETCRELGIDEEGTS